jgi:Cu(I)/Ag(I) efflux system membrane protein CusA/SilA
VVALEVCHRRLETLEPGMPAADRQARIAGAAGSFAPAILVSLLIAALSFLPVLAFTGETGRLLRPLALTKTLVILSAGLVSLTVAPALRAMLLRGRVTPEFANPITRGLVRVYQPFVHFALTRPLLTLLVAGLALASAVPISLRLGGEFLPRIDEGDLLYMPTTLPGAPADELASQLRLQDRALGNSEEIATVFGKIGRADTATDPAPLSMAETTIRLRPRADWPRVPRRRWYSSWAPLLLKGALNRVWPEESPATTAELIERLDRAVRLPGWASAWTAPARARLDMMATGIRTPVGIRIRAGDPDRLAELGATVRRIVADIPDTRSAVFESAGGEIWLEFIPDRPALSMHHVDLALVRATADLLLKGGQIGQLEKDGRLSRVRVVQDLNLRGPADALREITVRSSGDGPGQPVPLAFLGRPVFVSRPAMVRTEGADLVAYVYVDLAGGTDLLGYVARGQRALEAAMAAGELRLNPEERIEWAGQYRLLLSGARRLRLIVPLVALSMLALLYLQFRSLTEALIVLVSVPFALVGSCWTLYWLRYPLSAPVWVGLLSVIGLAMQTGVVMVVYIDEAFHRRVREGLLRSREDIVAAHAEGTVRRLRPKIMTVTTMAAGLLPLLWAEGAGSEILRRVAAPMIGGLLTSAFLTLEVLPVLYTIWRTRQLRRAQRLGVPIETIVGAVPGWARS